VIEQDEVQGWPFVDDDQAQLRKKREKQKPR
jgi:hypothetical protein